MPRGQHNVSPRLYSRLSRPEPVLFLQVAPQLYLRGWVDPVPDPLLLTKSGSARNRTRTSGSVAKNSDHLTTEAVIRLILEDNMKMGFKVIECEGVCWIHLTSDREQFQAFVNRRQWNDGLRKRHGISLPAERLLTSPVALSSLTVTGQFRNVRSKERPSVYADCKCIYFEWFIRAFISDKPWREEYTGYSNLARG
jgi:hypothetical protein